MVNVSYDADKDINLQYKIEPYFRSPAIAFTHTIGPMRYLTFPIQK